MKKGIFSIKENIEIAAGTYRMVLEGEKDVNIIPGQFINIKLDGFTLRRPVSVCDAYGSKIVICYRTAGEGTAAMREYEAGRKLDVLYGLGNGFDITVCGEKPLLAGGGIGSAPLYMLAKELAAAGKEVSCVLGFNTAKEVILADELRALGVDTRVVTVDGSAGDRGYPSEYLGGDCTYIYTCGPKAMLKGVYSSWNGDGQFSFEERMGCGFGACMGCTCKTKEGHKRICKDGPVLYKEEILWED